MSTLKSFLSILFISQTIDARSFNPCELEYELSNIYNLTTDESRNLTCVAQKYSQLTTNIINNGSKAIYYGIFQIGQKWCDIDKPGGKCNIKCEDLVDDDITDDIKCAQILFKKLGKKAWKLNKNSGCEKEFNYLDENCHKNANIDDTFQVQPDFCELARKLMTLYDISKIDATIWSCISEYSKTGNLNLRSEEEDGRDDEESCVKTRDVECAIKHNKQTGISGFTNWPEYEHYCKNITESTCFKDTKSVNSSDIIEQIKNVQNAETSKQPKIFTTSTEVSVFIEDDDGNLTQYSDTDITSESPKESQQTTEFLSDTLEKPSYDDKPTIDGYSKVRIMSADKNIVELPEALETTSKSLDKKMLIISSLAMSTSAELSHTKHTTEQIHLKYYETIDKCALAKAMNDSGRIPQNLISTFICIAEHESGLNVSFIDSDGQQSRYGLFQIDNQIYCGTNDNINHCNVLCAHLNDDQFDNDFECVRHIYKKEGLNYWPSYEKSCKNINSHSLDYCFEQFSTSQRPLVPHREAEYHSTKGTSEATLNEFTHMEMTTLINDVETAPSDGSLDFCEFSHQLKVNLSIEIWEDLVHYVCIADQISHLKPKLLNDDRLGIFGLKDNTCGKYQASGLCTILCSNLLNDDLIDDAECMIKVYKEHGLNEWNIDKDSCKPYTPKILNCIDEGRFSIPSDDEIDDKENLSIKSNYKDEDIQKIIAEITQMILSRAKIGTESVTNLEDPDPNPTTMASTKSTSFKEDTTIESEIQITTKKHIQNEKDLENDQQATTEAEKLDSTEKYQEEEEPEVAMKNIQNINTSEEIESTSFELKNDENDQNSSIKYDDDELNEKAIVGLKLLTTTTESLLDIEVMKIDLESKEDDTLETTVKTEEVTEEIVNVLEITDKIEASDDMELTTISVSEPEESTIKNDSIEQENNENEQVSNIQNKPKELEISTEEEDQTFLGISTESARYQEIEPTKMSIREPEETSIENDLKEQENNEYKQVSNIENDPKVLESSAEEEDQTFLQIEPTKMSIREPEETSIENDLKEQENNEYKQVSNIENNPKVLESSTEEEDQTFLGISTESAKYQEIEPTTMSVNEPEKSTIENDLKEQESNGNEQVSNIENDPKLLESSTEEEDQTFLEISTESAKYQKTEDQNTNRNKTEDHQQNENQDSIEAPKLENSSILDNYSSIESGITKPQSNQATEDYENIENESTDAEMLQKELFSENIEKSVKEETTTDIPLNFDDKTESFVPEILNSDNLLKNTEKSTEEEATSLNVLNIEPIPTESNESFSENTEKYIQLETTTENESISRTEEQIYLKSTTESSLTRNILDVTENLQELTEKLNEDMNNQTTESDEQDLTELEESTVATTKSDADSDIVVTTEQIYPQPTTESLYYTSIREIIEEYQKSNVKNLDNIQSKRNQNYSDEETTLDDLLEDYDDYTDDLVKVNQSIESLNQYTTFPITPSTIKTQYSRINKCELARYMNNSGFPENLIPTLICIAEYESELNPLAVKISKSHNRFGLFQIDDNIYCSTDEEIKECEVSCALLTDNQYDNDFECVRHIYKKEGFNYWPSYEKGCKNVSPNALDNCYEERNQPELEENEKIDNYQSTILEMSQIEDIPVTSDSPNINLDTLSADNESKSIVRTFDLCELTRELYSRNISIDDIPQYLCIADIKSDLKIKIPNVNDQNYGLFFINSEFCGQSESGGICSMKCSELWDSNISDDVDCVHKIIETNSTDKWNLNSKVCQIYDNKFLECFDKTTEFPKMSEIDFDGVQMNASVSRHDVITESEKMTDMISDMTDKNLKDLRQETSNLRSSNSDIESDEMTIDERAAQKVLPIEETTSKIIQILTSTTSTYDSTTENVDKQIRRVPLVEINLPREILNDQNLSKQVGTLIKNFTYFDVLPNNGSIIFNIFNFNIYGENHDIEYTINTGTDHKDRVGD